MRVIGPKISQCSREYADEHANEFDAVIGVCHTPAKNVAVPYLHWAVRDEDTPTFDDIQTWVDFGMQHLCYGKTLLVHCETGQNRSVIVAALLAAMPTLTPWDDTVARLHKEFMKCEPAHNWMPYNHCDKAVREWLNSFKDEHSK